MAAFVTAGFAIIGMALGQPWGQPWKQPWNPSPGSELSPCYYSADLCDCTAGTTFAVSHTTQTIGTNAADFKNVSGNCKSESDLDLPRIALY